MNFEFMTIDTPLPPCILQTRIFAIPSTQIQSDLKDVFCIAFCRNMEKWYLPAIQKVV